MANDVREVKNSSSILVSADKTTNMYLVSKDKYGKLLRDNITKNYKTCSNNTKHRIDQEASIIATKLGIANRMEVCAERKAYITLKDHKPEFQSRPSCRLINPAKSETGIVSKNILERINTEVRSATGLMQWRNTTAVIDWFKNLPSNQGLSFVKFDIVEFYPSITENYFAGPLALQNSTPLYPLRI